MVYKRKPDADERRFMAWVMEKPCCVPDCTRRPIVFHHETQNYPLPRRDHKLGSNICDGHHKDYHDHYGNNENFHATFGVWLNEVAEANKEEYFGE